MKNFKRLFAAIIFVNAISEATTKHEEDALHLNNKSSNPQDDAVKRKEDLDAA